MTSDHLYKCALTLLIGFVIAAFGAAMPWRAAIAIGTIIVCVGAFGLWRGRSAILRYGGGTLVTLLVIGIASAVGGRELNRAAGIRQPPTIRSQITVEPFAGLTMANYQRLDTGMSYAEVAAILGNGGEEMSRNEIAGITTVMYMWRRFGGGNMNAMFQNDRLIQKAQSGLR
jgi:hypothetical protein